MNTIREYISPIVWTEPNPGDVEYIQELGGLHYYMIGQSDYDGGGRLIGLWGLDGEPLQTPDPKYIELLALGNIGGLAHTPGLVNWQGRGTRLIQDPGSAVGLPEYPADQQPWQMQFRHQMQLGKHGWRVELPPQTLDPDDRAVAIYADPEFTTFNGTTGGLALVESLWQTDDEGNPLTVYGADCPTAILKDAPADWYLALWRSQFLSGVTLPAANDATATFWEFEQGGGSWGDSGSVTNGMAGTVVLFTPAPDPLFAEGQSVRIDGNEHTITSLWPSIASQQGFVLDPYQAYSAGLIIEIQQ